MHSDHVRGAHAAARADRNYEDTYTTVPLSCSITEWDRHGRFRNKIRIRALAGEEVDAGMECVTNFNVH